MIPRCLAIPNIVAPVNIDPEGVSERQDRDDGEGAGGNEGGAVGFGAEVDNESGH